ncbi:MAG: AEC family transporter [Anaerolineales bacterium]|jgi:predicted permease
METLLPRFIENILPIFITAGTGFLLGKLIEVEPRTISRITFYIFSPCLVFKLLSETELQQNAIIQMIVIAVGSAIIMGLITFLITKLLKFERKMIAAIMLTTMLVNAGNYGLALNDYAFGKDALAYASIYFVASGTTIYTLGVIVASMGKASLKDSFLGIFRLPILYALLLALVCRQMSWNLPTPIQRPIDLLGQAAVPGMLVLLGLQLQRARWGSLGWAIGIASGIRLLISPLVAFGLSLPFTLQGPALQAGITEASMPSAVMGTVLATEYDVEPAFVTTVVTVTTLLSPLTLTPLLAFLGG